MLPSQPVNKFETPINKENIISSTSLIKNQNNFQIFCKDLSKINELDEIGWTPLYRSIISGDVSSTIYLINNGADPNIKCTMGETPLYQAVEMEKIDHIKILLKNGADPNITNDDGISPLHTAVNKQNITIVKLLLKYGANPNLKSKLYQQTPLHLAIKNNADPIFLLLLVQFNGSLLKEDKFNKKPVDYTNSKEMKSIIEKLKLGKDEIKIEKEIEKYETPSKKIGWTPSNVYSNTIRSQSKGRDIIVGNSNTILKNPGNVKLTIIDGKNNIFCNDKNETVINEKNTETNCVKINDNMNDNENNDRIKNKENINPNENNVNININKYDKQSIESIELEDLNLDRKDIDYSFIRKKTGKFGGETQKDDNILENSDFLKNSLEQKFSKNKKKEIRLSDIGNNNKNSIRFSFSKNTFNNYKSNKIKKTLSKSIVDKKLIEENKENINSNLNKTNENIYENNINKENKSKTYKNNMNNNNKNKKKIIIKKYFNKEEKGNIKDNKEKIKDFNIKNCLYEKIIKKSITKIEIYDEEKGSNNQNKTVIYSTSNNKNSQPKNSNKSSLYNKKVINAKKINSLKKPIKIEENRPSIKSYKSFISAKANNIKKKSILPKHKNLKYKNLSFIKEKIGKQSMNMDTINSDNNKNIKNSFKSGGSLTTLTSSRNEYINNMNSKNNQSNINNQNNLWKFKNDILSSDKNMCLSILTNNLNSEASNDYSSNNNRYPIYNWLKEIGLHCYYNLFKEKKIFTMEKVISNLKSGKFKITKNDIEKIGIIIPGHIYRIITKLEIDSGKINSKISNFLKGTKIIAGKEINILNNSVYLCCGCCASNERSFYDKIRKDFNMDQWLLTIKMIKYRENFLENGFDLFKFFILQMFSSIPIDDYILKEELGIDNDKDRDIILLKLNEDTKYIIQKTEKFLNDEVVFDENVYEFEYSQPKEENSECIIV